jgi:Molybdopterin-guanine dinucleotide biosynthesis protein A
MRSCIILCGGRSQRMGQDKGLMTLEGDPLIIRSLKIVEKLSDEIILVLRDRKQLGLYQKCVNDFKSRIDNPNPNIKLVMDIEIDQGPLLGLYTGLSQIKSEGALVLPCDSPFISPYFVNKMFELKEANKTCVLVPMWPDGSTEPLHSYYCKESIHVIQKLLEDGYRHVKSLMDKIDVAFIDVGMLDPEKRSFINLNRPEDVPTSMKK